MATSSRVDSRRTRLRTRPTAGSCRCSRRRLMRPARRIRCLSPNRWAPLSSTSADRRSFFAPRQRRRRRQQRRHLRPRRRRQAPPQRLRLRLRLRRPRQRHCVRPAMTAGPSPLRSSGRVSSSSPRRIYSRPTPVRAVARFRLRSPSSAPALRSPQRRLSAGAGGCHDNRRKHPTEAPSDRTIKRLLSERRSLAFRQLPAGFRFCWLH